MGPTVCELDGPSPMLNRSNTDVVIALPNTGWAPF